MALSPRFHKLVDSHRAELEGARSTLAARTEPHDAIDLDHDLGVVTFRRGSRDLWQGHAILLGRLHLSAGRFEWFPIAIAQVPANVRVATPEFAKMQLPVISEAEAALLSDMVAHFRRAIGVLRRCEGPYVSFYALHPFDESRPSAPSAMGQLEWTVPPPTVDSIPPTGSRKAPSLPPVSAGAAGRPIRQPERDLVAPLAQAAVKAVDRALPGGFGQILVTIAVDSHEGKPHLAVSIVASDRRGDLVAVEPPGGMVDVVTTLLRADTASGNGRWAKLILRVRAHPTKLVMGVEVRP